MRDRYVVGSKTSPPCSFWRIKNIGILLCSESIAFAGAIEMSLSFMNLEHDGLGKNIEILKTSVTAIGPVIHDVNLIRSVGLMPFEAPLRRLVEFVYPEAYYRCRREGLSPIENSWAGTHNVIAALQPTYTRYEGDELTEFVFENVADFKTIFPEIDPDIAIMVLLKRAADQGSALAMNEMGVALLYCYQGVQHDMIAAIEWLDKTSERGDPTAKHNLARLHLAGLMEEQSSKSEAIDLLEQCSITDPELCAKDTQALKDILNDKK